MNLEKLKKKAEKLQKKDSDLIIIDFDDTIFSRKEQLEKDENLVKFRWEAGTKYILENIGIKKYIKKYYAWKKFPDSITSKLRKHHDLILTAWLKKFQKAKLKATWLNHFNYKIVDHAMKKPDKLIKYVVEDLGFIPKKIVVYEDRPNYFIENKKFIEEFLWTTLKIMFVEMKNNDEKPKITKIA